MKVIVLIGIGGIGRRHLQSLVTLDGQYKIYGIEKNVDTIEGLKKEFGDRVIFYDDIADLPKVIDVCIIATSSDVRRNVFDELIEYAKVKYIIFEKVLFQKIEDYQYVYQKLEDEGIRAWVNCTRREMDFYRGIKKELEPAKKISFKISGSEWGLGCNGIHMLDLMEFLSGDTEYSIEPSALLLPIVESKRKGFYEFYGTLTGQGEKCEFFSITCMHGPITPILITINSDISNIVIDEANRKVHVSKKECNWEWRSSNIQLPYTSQMTSGIVKRIMDSGSCDLPDYKSSMKTHIRFLNGVMAFLNINGIGEADRCPIT